MATTTTRMNFEVSEFRKRQIKAYVSLKNITIKDFFESLLNEKLGPEQSANIQDLTEEEKAIFDDADIFFSENSELCKKVGLEESVKIAEKVRAGGDLATLLGYENVK
ncbi:hypothetical protein B0186_08880 [Canicola haemoglobinophilus]|uniref:Uncharacterized protein n=1 Tax=Canicola haemoglobinophilus TaxID=733 RepID=A0A1V4AZN6_9PAST|nr:hypothetical protein [Canicola haemoglobinophilus]OOR98670.1 hypothetical protein B0186_08880 [Canicola haemoglobinophilus]STO53910.1 Uncharacterised protein [Canicola haemoglobinophilus]STO60653.1 Uncharacterised protein [Canicola haemoglobinophilus]STO68443.1 Uncharacterised protein [Canicola haemoglobinophilus]